MTPKFLFRDISSLEEFKQWMRPIANFCIFASPLLLATWLLILTDAISKLFLLIYSAGWFSLGVALKRALAIFDKDRLKAITIIDRSFLVFVGLAILGTGYEGYVFYCDAMFSSSFGILYFALCALGGLYLVLRIKNTLAHAKSFAADAEKIGA